jgi:hypothetical protein
VRTAGAEAARRKAVVATAPAPAIVLDFHLPSPEDRRPSYPDASAVGHLCPKTPSARPSRTGVRVRGYSTGPPLPRIGRFWALLLGGK